MDCRPSSSSRNARAFTAQDKIDFAEATAFAKEAEQAILEKRTECNGYPLRFTRVRHVLDLSMMFVSSLQDSLRLPNEALHLLESEVPFFDETRSAQYQQLYCNLIQTRASIDKKEYPYAANLLIDALAISEELHSLIHLSEVEASYHRLKASSYTHQSG